MYDGDIADCLVEQGFDRRDATLFIKAFVETISHYLGNGEAVKIHGLGTFCVRDHAPRVSRDVRSGEWFVVEAYKYVFFIPSKKLKEVVASHKGKGNKRLHI